MSMARMLALGLVISTGCVAQQVVDIHLTANGPGRVYEGLGALSAGASSRLLVDYPEPQRSQILDYLFKPNYGANLQHLKVEIGADVNSTDGSEPSHMRSRTDHNYTRGYEWWLMREARKRNPKIMLDTLAWGAPGWVGGGQFYSQDMADYIADFLLGAKKQGLNIDYTGEWNERKADYEWTKLLRRTLDAKGLQSVKIVCCDSLARAGQYDVFYAMQKDLELAKDVVAIGVHYPKSNKTLNLIPPDVAASGRTVWSSEDQPNPGGGPFLQRDWEHGGRIMARRYNENYITGRMTKTEIWSPITSYYDNLAAPNSGLMYANTPWSGHYDVQSTIWVTAHTTQFAQPGWTYIDSASAYFPDDAGSYVALRSPSTNGMANWSVVLETINAKAPQHVRLHVGKGLASKRVYVWESNSKRMFAPVALLSVKNGAVEYTFAPDAIYTLTTTTGQHKGSAAPPADKPFPFPYRDDFEQTPLNSAAKYLADQDGAFESHDCMGRSGRCLEQVITVKPIPWLVLPYPFTYAGDVKWKDYAVKADMMIPAAGTATLLGRIESADVFADRKALYPSGYVFRIDSNGTWQLLSNRFKQQARVLAQGKGSFAKGWMKAEMRFRGQTITVTLGGKQLTQVSDKDHINGMAGVGTEWNHAQFDNFAVEP